MSDTKQDIIAWAASHLSVAHAKECKACWWWEKTWLATNDNLVLRLKLFPHDDGGWIITGACASGYSGNEDEWSDSNMGSAVSVASLQRLYDWFELQAKASCQECDRVCAEWGRRFRQAQKREQT